MLTKNDKIEGAIYDYPYLNRLRLQRMNFVHCNAQHGTHIAKCPRSLDKWDVMMHIDDHWYCPHDSI